MNEITFSLLDLANFILYTLGTAALVVLIITFININRLVKRVNKLVEKNEDNINRTVTTMPEAINNVNEVSLGIKRGIDKAGAAMETLESSICETVTAVSEGTEGFFDFVSIAGEVLKAVLSIFPFGKKK
ncbi:MAG: hypothetical protein ACOYWZ_23225 [Bacillota bacterium]